MREARDTFLHFLQDNLPGVIVRNLRRDSDDPSLAELAVNALNVQFIGDDLQIHISKLMVTMDIIFDEELSAIDCMNKIWGILSPGAYSPLLDYTDPTTPVATGSNLYWNQDSIRFRPIVSELTFRYNCTLQLSYTIP